MAAARSEGSTSTDITTVLIVGAGPTGLTLAVSLVLIGAPVAIYFALGRE